MSPLAAGPRGDDELFQRRFEWGSLDRDEVRAALAHRPATHETVKELAERTDKLPDVLTLE